VYRWGDNIQADILDMVCALLDLLHARLRSLGPSPEADEEDLVPMLSSLATALDPSVSFHVKHRMDALPSRARGEPYGVAYAEARPEVELMSVRLHTDTTLKKLSARALLPGSALAWRAAAGRARARGASRRARHATRLTRAARRARSGAAGGRGRRHGPRQRAQSPLADAHCQLLWPLRRAGRAAGGARRTRPPAPHARRAHAAPQRRAHAGQSLT
jgi:hypothetical protein